MRFVFLSHNYSADVSSPESWVDRIKFYAGSLEYLSKANQVVRVDQINYTGELYHQGIQYKFVNYRREKSYIPLRLHRLVKKLKPEIVIVHGLHYPLQVIQLRMHLGKKPKIILQNHAEKPFKGIKKWFQRLADFFVDGYFFTSSEMGAEWVKCGNLASRKKIHEIMEVSSSFSPINKATARSRTGASGQPIYLWVGRLNENKNPLMVVRAFSKFLEFHPLARLYMVYHTSELAVELRQLIAARKSVADAVVMVGKISHDQLLYWYNSADFFISGSYFESGGTAVCEAMSCGCIPILTDIFSFRMMTGNQSCGLLYEPGNENELLVALKQSLDMDFELDRERTLFQFRDRLSFRAIALGIQKVAAGL